jgi:ribonuclease HIII
MLTLDNISREDLEPLKRFGFCEIPTKTEYEEIRLKGVCSVTLYKSGKLLVQGKDCNIELIQKLLSDVKKKPLKKQEGSIIGTDECLKGDTFGGLVVAGFRSDEKIRADLSIMGVRDSKSIADLAIKKLAIALKNRYPKNYCIKSLMPREYNRELQKGNITLLLNKLHKACYTELNIKKQRSLHIVDKYPGCKVGDIAEEKADSKYLEVAAASILARDAGLEQIMLLARGAGFKIPKGSTHVSSALIAIKNKRLDPRNFAKIDFSNVKKILKQKS